MASTALVSVTAPASAANCLAFDQTSYNTCVTTAATNDVIIVTAAVSHNFAVANPGVTIQVDPGGAVTDGGASFGAGTTRLVINGTGTVSTTGVDVFASLAGNGTLITPSLQAVIFGDTTNTAFSGTWNAPDLNTALIKTGSGTLTINGMTAANGDFLEWQGLILQSGGSTNIKSIAVGTGTGNSANMNVTGGTLTFTGTGLVGTPCSSQCPALRIGDFGGTGIFAQSAGTVNIGAAGVAGSMNIGNQGGTGTYNMSGGTLNLGVFGDVNSAGLYAVGRSTTNTRNSVGVFNISGGLVSVNAGELVNGDRDVIDGATLAATSSTINLSGGILRVRNGANLWLSAANNANAIDSIFSLSGTGVLEIGDGRLQDNYNGGGGAYQFNLNGGTIRVIDSDLTTTVNAILLGASATTGTQIDTNGLNANWNGILSGAGWIVKTGAGTLNLGGVNTYTGGTAFNGGVVVADVDTDLGATTAAMSFNGGTLRLGAAGVLTLRTGGTNMAGAGTIDTNGFSTTYDGNITGAGALTKVGAGTLVLGGNNNAHTGALNINAGIVHTDFGNAIGNTSAVTVAAPAILEIHNSETIGSLAGAGSLNVFAGATLTTGSNNTSTTWTGTTVATTGGLTKAGTGAFTVNANLTYTGLTTVNGGTMILNGSMADSLLVAAGATFGGNANIAGNVTNLGTLSPGNSPGTINIAGNYAGPGIFNMEVQFNNAGAPINGTTHDFVNITGNATGATLLNVIPFAPSNAPVATTGNGIELVRVGGTTGAGQFSLAAPVFEGAFEYVLAYIPTVGPDGYFLQSRLNETFFAEGAMFAASQAMMGACFGSEDGLVGDGNGHAGRGWAKVTHGGRETGADTGIDTDQSYTCGSGGFDVRAAGNWRIGIAAGYGDSSTDVTTAAGVGQLDGSASMIQMNAAMHHGAFFANLVAGFGQSDWEYIGPSATLGDASMAGFFGSVQLGALWPIGTDWRFGAIAELNYDGLDCDDDCLVPGTSVDAASVFWKGTVRLDGSMSGGKVLPFLALSFSDGDENSFTNGVASFVTDTNAALFDAKAGATIMVGSKTALFINGGLAEGLDNDVSGWDGTAGLKVMW